MPYHTMTYADLAALEQMPPFLPLYRKGTVLTAYLPDEGQTEEALTAWAEETEVRFPSVSLAIVLVTDYPPDMVLR